MGLKCLVQSPTAESGQRPRLAADATAHCPVSFGIAEASHLLEQGGDGGRGCRQGQARRRRTGALRTESRHQPPAQEVRTKPSTRVYPLYLASWVTEVCKRNNNTSLSLRNSHVSVLFMESWRPHLERG